MNCRAIACFVLLLAGALASANEQVRRVQEELRKRNVYFGEVDGRKTDEITRAIRRYQQRQGFPATGEADEGTLRSLNIPPGPVKPDEEWPEGTIVMKGDSARQVTEADKKALERWNAAEPPTVAAEGGAQTPETAAQKPEAGSQKAEAGSLKAESIPEPGVTVEPPPLDRAKLTPPKIASTPPEPRPAPENKAPQTEPPPPPIAEIDRGSRPKVSAKDFGPAPDPETFVRRYLDACASNRLGAELSFYAPKLSYFDHGVVDKNFVARDVQRFYERWPQRRYELISCEQSPLPTGERQVVFKIAFQYENPDKQQKVSGRSVNVFKIRNFETGPRFTSMKEQRLRN